MLLADFVVHILYGYLGMLGGLVAIILLRMYYFRVGIEVRIPQFRRCGPVSESLAVEDVSSEEASDDPEEPPVAVE